MRGVAEEPPRLVQHEHLEVSRLTSGFSDRRGRPVEQEVEEQRLQHQRHAVEALEIHCTGRAQG